MAQHSTDHAASAQGNYTAGSFAMEYRRLGSTGLKVGCWHGGGPAMRRMCISSMLTSPNMLLARLRGIWRGAGDTCTLTPNPLWLCVCRSAC